MWPLLSFFVDLRIIQYVVMFNNNVRQVVFEIQSHATLKDGVLSWYQVNMDPVSMVLFLIHFYKIRWLFTIWLIWADFLFISLLWLILYIYNNFFICALLFWIPFKIVYKIILEMMQKSSDLMQDMSRNGFVIVTFPENCLFWPAFYLNHSDCILTKNWKNYINIEIEKKQLFFTETIQCVFWMFWLKLVQRSRTWTSKTLLVQQLRVSAESSDSSVIACELCKDLPQWKSRCAAWEPESCWWWTDWRRRWHETCNTISST